MEDNLKKQIDRLQAELDKLKGLIEEEKIYIGENEVQYYKSEAKILGRYFTYHEVEVLRSVTPELFGKILKRMEG